MSCVGWERMYRDAVTNWQEREVVLSGRIRTMKDEIAALKAEIQSDGEVCTKMEAEIDALKEANRTLERSWLNACDEAAALKAERQELYDTLTVRAMNAEGQVRVLNAENERLRGLLRRCWELLSHDDPTGGCQCVDCRMIDAIRAALERKP